MKKATPATDQKRKKRQEKTLGKLEAAAKKCLNKDSCSSICYSNNYEYIVCSRFLMSQQLLRPSFRHKTTQG